MSGAGPATTADVEKMVVDFIENELGETDASELGRDDNLFASGLVDSVGIVRLIGHLEKELEVTVPPPELVPRNFRTLAVMSEFLLGLRQG